ncbi:MAG: DotA/TraY family protein, partial [Francisellaceae bacterium]
KIFRHEKKEVILRAFLKGQFKYQIPLSLNIYPTGDGGSIPSFTNKAGKKEYASDINTLSSDSIINSTTNSIPQGINITTDNWSQMVEDVAPLPTNSGNCTGSGSDGGDCQNYDSISQLRADLYELPKSMQPSFIYLFNILKSKGQTLTSNQAVVTYLNNVFLFLRQNGIYQVSSSQQVPIYGVINTIFTHLTSQSNGNDISSVMQEIYNLGDSNNIGIYSKILQTQQVGADIINTVISSFNAIFESYSDELNDIQGTAEDKINNYSDTVYASFLSTFWIPGVGPTLASGATQISAMVGQMKMQLFMAKQMGTLALNLAWLPIAIFVLVSLFTAGISFALMVPLIPYFLFWAGAIVWVLSVLEGLVAMPIVAMIVAYPEGNEVLGHGSPAVKIALNIIFRPVLMVIGITTAMALTYILITYSAQGFHMVVPTLLNNFTSSAMVKGIVSCFLVLIFGSFMMMAFNKCFSVIYLIPDKVFEWIGSHSSNARAGAEEVAQLQSKSEQSAQQGAQSAGQATEQGISAKRHETEQTVQAEETKIQVAQKVSDTANNAIQSESQGVAQAAEKIGPALL